MIDPHSPEFNGLGAIVFDFDGVLVESNELKAEAFYRLYLPFGKDIANHVANDHRRNQGVSRYIKIRKWHADLLGVALSDQEVETMARQFGDLVKSAVIDAPMVDGSMDFLKVWAGRVPMYVASATPESELREIATAKGIAGFFTDIGGFPRKKTELLALAAHACGAANVIMVGDAIQDLEAARSAGARFIGRICDGNDALFTGMPCFRSFRELPGCISATLTSD